MSLKRKGRNRPNIYKIKPIFTFEWDFRAGPQPGSTCSSQPNAYKPGKNWGEKEAEERGVQTRRHRRTQTSAVDCAMGGHLSRSINPQDFGFQTWKLSCLLWGPRRDINQAPTPLTQQAVVTHMFERRHCLPVREKLFLICAHASWIGQPSSGSPRPLVAGVFTWPRTCLSPTRLP